MNNKDVVLRGLFSAIGFIRATAPYDVRDEIISELNSAVNSVRNNEPHEEYKTAWLNIVNTLHCIDPNWQENTQGESEWEKAVAFISQMNQELKKATDTLGSLKHTYVGIDFAASVSGNIDRQILEDGLFKAGQHTLNIFSPSPHSKAVYFRDLLRSVAITQIKEELAAAEKKHPTWPTDIIHASAILNEEAGELTQAAIDYHYDIGSLEAIRREAAQVGAMAIRVLINLPYAERPASSEKKVTGAPR